ncbi:MAG: hypothetical protein ACYDCO_17080 [Armatimonadota bacterium]
MEEAIAWILVVIAFLVALPFILKFILIGGYWFFAVVSHQFFGIMDEMTNAPLIPGAPWVMWLIWGAVIGAALAFWTIAPIYGLRKQRLWIVLLPFVLMAVMAGTRHLLK